VSRRLGAVFALCVVLLLLVGGVGGTLVYARFQLEPRSSTQAMPISVTVRAGESIGAVSDDLAGLGIVRSSFWFAAFARFESVHLHAGTFTVDAGMASSEIVARLNGPSTPSVNGSVKLLIPEGLDIDQIADRVAASGLQITRQQYLDAVADDSYTAAFLSIRPAGDTSLEGFLFPDTFDVPKSATAHQVIQMQLDDFATRVVPLLPKSASEAYADLTTASIIEREADMTVDYPQVASVINNRLADGMDLQLDSTVVYGLHMVGQEMSSADEAVDTPFNTYLNPGLTPTPISNPGLATLGGALHPASTDYLFYVTDACGYNHYSVTEVQHEQQVAEYLDSCPEQSPSS
jgi:UPF0755 protein